MGTISGTVTDRAGQAASACATAFDEKEHSWSAVTPTDEHGNYTLSGLLPAEYTVYFADCYASPIESRVMVKREFLPQWLGPSDDFGHAKFVSIGLGESIGGVSAVLIRGSHIRGKLSRANAKPIQGIEVDAYSVGADAITSSAVSASDGTFDIPLLRQGSYQLFFWDEQQQSYYHDRLWYPGTRLRPMASSVNVGIEDSRDIGEVVLPEFSPPSNFARAATLIDRIPDVIASSNDCCLAELNAEDTGMVTGNGGMRSTTTSRAWTASGFAHADAHAQNPIEFHVQPPGYDIAVQLSVGTADAQAEATCASTTGYAEIGNLRVNGILVPIANNPAPNTRMEVAGITVVLNEQIRIRGDDQSLAVTAIHILATNQRIGYAFADLKACPA